MNVVILEQQRTAYYGTDVVTSMPTNLGSGGLPSDRLAICLRQACYLIKWAACSL